MARKSVLQMRSNLYPIAWVLLTLISGASAYFNNDLYLNPLLALGSAIVSIGLCGLIIRSTWPKKWPTTIALFILFVGQWWITQGLILFLWLGFAWRGSNYHP